MKNKSSSLQVYVGYASNRMFRGMPTENQEMFRAASSGEYVYVGYSRKANK
jgi:hypothetical protein